MIEFRLAADEQNAVKTSPVLSFQPLDAGGA